MVERENGANNDGGRMASGDGDGVVAWCGVAWWYGVWCGVMCCGVGWGAGYRFS